MKMRSGCIGMNNGGRSKGVLWTILLLSVVIRLISALYQGNEVKDLPGIADQVSYHRLSTRVLNGSGFSFDVGWWPATPAGQPTAHWSFLYVLFLTGIYAIFGPVPMAARIAQAVLAGVLQPLLTWRIGTRLLGSKVGIAAAALSALYGYFAYYGGSLMTESFYIVAVLWVVDIATAIAGHADRKRILPWLMLGLACAVAVLLRQVFLLVVPVILLWIAWRLGFVVRQLTWAQLLGRFLLIAAVLTLCIVPWTLRNRRAFDTFVLLNTNAGFAFFWGNHPIHGTRFIPILTPEQYGLMIPDDVRGLNEAKMDRALLVRGLAFVRDNPTRYLRLSLSRTVEYFKFWPSRESGRISNWIRMLSFGVILPLSIAGFFCMAYSRLRGKNPDLTPRSPGIALILLLGSSYTFLHLTTWTLIRYRLPMDAIFMPVAALGAVTIFGFCTKRANGLQ
jgi:4-amino-4-deoxy-L-arabinose transferase-like glycosyltransferase